MKATEYQILLQNIIGFIMLCSYIMTPMSIYLLSCWHFTKEGMTSMTLRLTKWIISTQIGFSTPKMPENDTHNPKFSEFIIFHHGQLYEKYDNGRLICSFLCKIIKTITVLSRYFVTNGQKTGIPRSISVTANGGQFCQLLLLEIVEMNHHSNF